MKCEFWKNVNIPKWTGRKRATKKVNSEQQLLHVKLDWWKAQWNIWIHPICLFGIWYSYALPYILLFHVWKNVDGSKLIKALCICREYQLSSIASFIRPSILFLFVFSLFFLCQLMCCGADPRWDQFYRRFSYMTTIQIALEHFFSDAYIKRRDIRHEAIHFELFLRPFNLTIIWSEHGEILRHWK